MCKGYTNQVMVNANTMRILRLTARKEKIGAAYVTIMIRGDVAAVQTAIEVGRQTVERLGGKLILADVIARPHADLSALLPS